MFWAVFTGSHNLTDNLFKTNDVHNLATCNFTVLFVFFFRRNDAKSQQFVERPLHSRAMAQWFEQSMIAIVVLVLVENICSL